MFCTKCGAELKDGSKFCTKCGNQLSVPNEKTSEKKDNNNVPSEQKDTNNTSDAQKGTFILSGINPDNINGASAGNAGNTNAAITGNAGGANVASSGNANESKTEYVNDSGIDVANIVGNTTPSDNDKKKNTGLFVVLGFAGLLLVAAIVFIVIVLIKVNGGHTPFGLFDSESRYEEEEEEEEGEGEDEEPGEGGEKEGGGTGENGGGAGSNGGTGEGPGGDTTQVQQDGLVILDASTPAGRLQNKIIEMNANDYELQKIDIYADNYKPGVRVDTATWDSGVFYTLEGYQHTAGYYNKNVCSLVKKELINAATNNIIDYEIYLNPDNGKPNKIVSIEYLDNGSSGIEVTEYYYTNEPKVSFIFKYKTDNYVSSYATPDKDGERFIFDNDSLLTWREVIGGNVMNYCFGSTEAARNRKQWGKNRVVEHAQFDSGRMEAFDKAEDDMINAAYNTYYMVMSMEGIARIQGSIYNNDSQGIPDAVIELYDEGFQNVIYRVNTNENGDYLIYVPTDNYRYNIRACKNNMTSCDIYGIVIDNGQIGAYQDTAYLMDCNASDVTANLTLGDAFNSDGNGMLKLKNATVLVRRGINNYNGDVIHTGVTDTNGNIILTLAPDVYTIEVDASGYETMYYSTVLRTGYDNIFEYYAAPELSDSEYAIVLTWGYHPEDLDSHLFTTKGGSSDHIWYGDPYDNFNNFLDVDDTTSYGPETVTIRSFSPDDYYKYCVVDYTECARGYTTSYDMSFSGATVNVYSSNGLIGTYHVPTNVSGVIWEVFEIRNGVLTPIQRYYNNVSDKSWWHGEK